MKNFPAFILALAFGFAIWAASKAVTGRAEPWDAQGFYFAGSLLVSGFVAGWLDPGNLKRNVLGIYSGQTLAILSRGDLGLFIPMGAIVLAVFTLLSLAAGFIAIRIRSRF